MVDGGAADLSLVVMRVVDLASSRVFYERLGLSFRREQHGSGPEHLSTVLGGVVLELYPLGTSSSTDGLRIGLRVRDLDGIVERAGSAVLADSSRDGARVVVVQDPDGHKVELSER